ncbi:MAG: cysteine-rich CWC family protein [Bacteroidales bacterium]|nr:cysteine-rich CWC family protein [Bacteroidales bacterium]
MKRKICPKCSKEFNCLNNSDCWCLKYKISEENLTILKNTYKDCVCEECLKGFAIQ